MSAVTNPFDHPDAQRRFRVMKNVEELERALDYLPLNDAEIVVRVAGDKQVETSGSAE